MTNPKLLFPFIMAIAAFSCNTPKEEVQFKSAADYFPKDKTKILLVGTFHFDYPGLDAIDGNEEDKIDVLKEPKKSEVTELINYIKKFKPNKIAIEATDDWKATDKLREYKNGKYQDQRDERFQIGMRLATALNLDTLYAIDTNPFVEDLEKLDTAFIPTLFKDFDFKSDDPYYQMAVKWVEDENKLVPKVSILDYIKHINSKESHQYGYGLYLVGDFKLGDTRGADVLSVWWYNRNLRIFRNIQRITESKEDRILVVFGNGHAAILRDLIEASPEYDWVEFDNLQ